MNRPKKTLAALSGPAFLALVGVVPAAGQDLSAVLAGYGSAGYQAQFTDDETPNDFSASISPILLFQAGDNVLFETELELELEGGETETSLEYAQVEYLGFERVQVAAGKFLLPFGVFSERLHPSWINKMPNAPPIYGHGHGGVAEGAVLPVLSDVGFMTRYAQPLGELWRLDISGWISQGPRIASSDSGDEHGEEEAHALAPLSDQLILADEVHDEVGAEQSMFDIPDVGFGVSFDDNNENKMLGARVGFTWRGDFEMYLSGFHAMYDDEDFLDITGYNLAAEWRRGPFEARGEAILLRQEFVNEDRYDTANRPGYYVQVARRWADFEPVIRWAQLLDTEVDGATAREGYDQLAVGLDYWISPSVPVKVAWEANMDRDDRFLFQWAFGF